MKTSESESIATRFYQAFQRKDGEGMAKCYAPDAHFSDPVFPDLKGREVGEMWKMLCERSADITIDFKIQSETPTSATVTWDANYTFTRTGRKVLNQVTTTMKISGNQIQDQVDRFDFWRWSRQAFGPLGILIGWTPILKNKVRGEAGRALQKRLERSR